MASNNAERMPLLEHLRELRKRVFRASFAITLGSVFGWVFYNEIITTLAAPVCDLKGAQESGAASCGGLYINGVLGPFNLQVKVALLAGIIVSAPFWLYQFWAFIAPALHRKEKRTTIFFILFATPFFSAGAYLGYLILPLAIKMLFGFTPTSLSNLIKFDDYLDFVLRIILIFGLAFELPVFLVTLNAIGFIRGTTILKPWRVWVFAIFLFTAAFTPTPDPLTMTLLALPLILLYFIAGVIGVIVDRRRDNKQMKIETRATGIEPPTPINE